MIRYSCVLGMTPLPDYLSSVEVSNASISYYVVWTIAFIFGSSLLSSCAAIPAVFGDNIKMLNQTSSLCLHCRLHPASQRCNKTNIQKFAAGVRNDIAIVYTYTNTHLYTHMHTCTHRCKYTCVLTYIRSLPLNLLKTERRPHYFKAQSVLRCKYFSSRL
jgi:hypothetical protein